MDLKLYYQKVREMEARIEEPYPIVRSLETPDGGREGALKEVPQRVAAKLLVEGQAVLASKGEAMAFLEAQAEAKRVADQIVAAARIQLSVISTDELHRLKHKPDALED